MQSVDVEAGDVFTFADLWFLIGVLDRSIMKIQKATFVADLWCVTVACGQDRFNVNADQLDSFLQQLQAGHTGYLDQPLFNFFRFLKAQCFPKPPWVYWVLYLYLPVVVDGGPFSLHVEIPRKNSGFSHGFSLIWIDLVIHVLPFWTTGETRSPGSEWPWPQHRGSWGTSGLRGLEFLRISFRWVDFTGNGCWISSNNGKNTGLIEIPCDPYWVVVIGWNWRTFQTSISTFEDVCGSLI